MALGYVDEPAPRLLAGRGEWLASPGVPEDEWDTGAWLCDPDGMGSRLSILPVPEAKVAKNRLHMDVRVERGEDPDDPWAGRRALVETLVDAGGRFIAEFRAHHVVMADPLGNEFCVALEDDRAGRLAPD